MKRHWLNLGLCLIIAPLLCGKSVSLENERIQLTVHSNGAVEVRNLDTETTWRQAIPRKRTAFALSKLKSGTDEIEFELDTIPPTKVTWKIIDRKADILVEIRPIEINGDMPDNIPYPYPFVPPSKEAEWVLPNRSGALYPVTETVFGPKPWKIGGKELLMSWYGLIDSENKTGMITVYDTPHDAELTFAKVEDYVAPQTQWLPSMGTFGETRRIRYHFSENGGYVALAKYYRQLKIDSGEFKTLREKVAQNPEVAKLIGGFNARIIHNNEGLSAKYLTKLPDYGIEKGSLCVRAKDDIKGIITHDIVSTLANQGFLLTNWSTKKWVMTQTDNPLHPQYMKNPNLVLEADGSAFSKNELKGTGEEGGMQLICDTSTKERFNQFINRIQEGYPLKPIGFTATGSLKIDTLCGDLYECHDPRHPQTRKQSMESRIEMLKDLKDQGFVLSAEGGDESYIPYLDTAYGPLGLQRSQGRKVASATWSIKKPVDPKIGPLYDEYYFGPARRVPLFDLVYHDCIVTTFHDGDSNNMYYKTEAEGEKYWRLKELFQILHGQAPNFYLTVDDFFEEQHSRIRKTIKTVCKWHEQVAFDEMVTHQFLTEDRMLQESRFSSGLCVVVNFSADKSLQSEYGIVEPLDYRIARWR